MHIRELYAIGAHNIKHFITFSERRKGVEVKLACRFSRKEYMRLDCTAKHKTNFIITWRSVNMYVKCAVTERNLERFLVH